MKIIKKANVSSNALKVPSEAADKLGIVMKVFIRKNMDTLKETLICTIQFKDERGGITQTEDIIVNTVSIASLDGYSIKLKENVQITMNRDGEEYQSTTNCIKDLKKFIRNKSNEIPVRLYYDTGYGWSKDEVIGKVRFDGSSIAGLDNIILDDYKHHLVKKGEYVKTIEVCNEVMHDRFSTQFLLAASLAAPIFGALDLKSLIVNVSGRSSQGKTSILELCMSLWSKPDDENLATTWYNTENAICAKLNGLEGVPFILDDTSQGSTKNYTKIVYNMEGGKSKGRLNKLFSIDSIAKWHTCIFSASENSMYEQTDDDKKGLLRRLVELEVQQGDLIKDQVQASKVNKISRENYGQLGMIFVNKLFENKLADNNFEELKKLLNKKVNEILSKITENGISKGIAEKLAVIMLTVKLSNEYLDLQFNVDKLEEYILTLIAKTDVKVKEAIRIKQDFETCLERICEFTESKLENRYKTELCYNIPVPYFNLIEAKLGYKYKELRALLLEKGHLADFNDKDLDKTIRRPNLRPGESKTLKVIAVTKNLNTLN
ncbi:DUF927 domain-containing protein [Clostridium sp.]|mgnify:CR=1 FL=1|uniref:DUF927 domain-containing protein n=1 Tax=Clostridium sp. TaxID=1506 RepID=UPI002FDD37BF